MSSENIQDDIEKLDAFLNCEESSDDSDTSLDEEEVDIETASDVGVANVNIEFNDIRPYNEQVVNIICNVSTVNLNTVLMLNAAQQNLLIEAIKKYQRLLQHCDEQINRVKIMKQELMSKKKDKISSWYHCGVPYFKNISLRHNCPSNSDVSNKIKSGAVSLIDLPPCRFWMAHEKEILKKAVLVSSKQIRIRMIRDKSQNYQENIEEWTNKPPKECVFPVCDKNVLIDWLKISIHDLKGRHTDEECKAMWYQHLHPHLNNKPYGPREAQRLKEIATKYNFQNWDSIAEELGTNRSGYHCCLFNRLNQNKELNKRALKWTEEEDSRVLSLVEKFKIGNYIPWGRIAHSFPNRDKTQIYNRHHTSLRAELKKGKFTKQEDLMLLSLSKKFGDDIKKISSFFKGRNLSQIRIRYTSLVLNECKSTQWTEEEDKRIIEFVKANYKPDQSISWAQLETLFDNPCRTRTSIRHRWSTIKNYLNSSFEGDLSVIPRPQKKRKSVPVKQTHLENVMMILNDEQAKICNLADITEEVLSMEIKHDLIDQFQHFFIKKFSKIRFNQPIKILEMDIVNTLFLINILHGSINLELLYHKRYKNCYTERNETDIVNFLKEIVEKMNENCDETVLNCLKGMHLSLPQSDKDTDTDNQIQTINSIIPKCFISIDEIDHMIAIVKPFLKYVLWKDSELDQFYNKITTRFERNLKSHFFADEKSLQHYEQTIVTSAATITCDMFLDGSEARSFKSTRITELFKMRFMAIINFKSMQSIAKELLRLSQKIIKTEYSAPAPTSDKKIKSKGRPRKMLPGGRYKYKKGDEIKTVPLENETCSVSNQVQSEQNNVKLDSTNIKEELLQGDTESSQNESNGLENEAEADNNYGPVLKKIKFNQ